MMHPIPAAAIGTLLATCITTGCTTDPDPAQLALTMQLTRQTDSMIAEIDVTDTAALRHMAALFAVERTAIEQRFKDTLSPHEAEVLGNYHRAMAERLPGLLAQRSGLRARMDSTATRLHDLRHDMELGLMNSRKRAEAIEAEKRWNAFLRQNLDSLNARTRNLVRDRKAWRAAIDSLLRP